MKDPVRLLEGHATATERLLLGAAAEEEPAESGRQRLAAALGVVVAPASVAGASASVAPAAALSTKLGAKWLAIVGITAAGAVAVVYSEMRESAPRQAAVSRSSDEQTSVPATNRVEPRALEPQEPKGAAVAAPPVLAEKQSTRSRAPAAPDRADEAPSIAGEIQEIDRARVHLSSGAPALALERIAAYRRAFPNGVLRQEAALLTIEALARSGDRSAARQAARRFLRDHPNTPHEGRIESLVGDIR